MGELFERWCADAARRLVIGAAARRRSNPKARALALEPLEYRRLLAASFVLDINPGTAGSFVLGPADRSPSAVTNGKLVFSANDGTRGSEPWVTDGTSAGTKLLLDINPGNINASPLYFVSSGGAVLFTATDPVAGRELWRTDGTAEGTQLFKDIHPTGNGNPLNLTRAPDGTIYFWAASPDHPTELWRSDGTEDGTQRVKGFTAGAAPRSIFITGNGRLFFPMPDGATGNELWTSDGTEAGTQLVKDIRPGAASGLVSSAGVPSATLAAAATSSELFFYADAGDGGGLDLWKSDGTEAGTTRVLVADPQTLVPTNIRAAGDTVFFVNTTAETGTELWRTDSTSAGTFLLADLNPGPVTALPPAQLLAVGNQMYFRGSTSATGTELFVSDGTVAGTRLVKDATDSPVGSVPVPLVATPDGHVYFRTNGAGGSQLWVTRGTAETTEPVVFNTSGTSPTSPSLIGALGNDVIVSAFDSVNGQEPWIANTAPPPPPPENEPPTAVVLGPDIIGEGSAGMLFGRDSTDPDGQVVAWEWDLNYDGTTFDVDRTTEDASFTAPNGPTTHRVALRVTDDDGAVSAITTLTIPVENRPPTVVLNNVESIVEGTATNVFVSIQDPSWVRGATGGVIAGDSVGFTWSVKNLAGSVIATGSGTAKGPSHTIPAFIPDDGLHTFTVVATDGDGGVGTASSTILGRNVAPTLQVGGLPTSVSEGSTVSLALSSTDQGADTISHWSIDWGDGTVETIPGDPPSVQHVYADSSPNQYLVRVTATDEDGTYSFTGVTTFSGPDPTFGNGTGRTLLAIESHWAPADNGFVIARDGSVVVAGQGANDDNDWIVQRVRPDGTIDTAFGVNGVVSIEMPGGYFGGGVPHAVAELPDGKILIGGGRQGNGGALVRLLPDGQLDTTFGDGGRLLIADNRIGRVHELHALPDGKVLVAASFDLGPAIFRFDVSGALDPTFGVAGMARPNLGFAAASESYQLRVLDDGRILLGMSGTFSATGLSRVVVVRFSASGALDGTFGTSNHGELSFAGTTLGRSNLHDMAIDEDGKILLAGTSDDGSFRWAAGRLTANGMPDSTFGIGGVRRTSISIANTGVHIEPAADGRIIMTGATTRNTPGWDMILLALRADGSDDPSAFDGEATKALPRVHGTFDQVFATAKDAQGRLMMLGGYLDKIAMHRIVLPETASRLIKVNNVAPVVRNLQWTDRVAEGTNTAVIIMGDPFDPSPSDMAQLRYSYDFDGDGAFDLVDVPDGEVAIPTALYADGPRTLNMVARVTDKDGGFTQYARTMQVFNTAPVVQMSEAPQGAREGDTITFTGSATDTAPDAAAGLPLEWEVIYRGSTLATGTGDDITFTADDHGSYIVYLRATDKDGDVGFTSRTVEVASVPPTPVINGAPATALEGDVISLSAGALDPSGADAAAGFTYFWIVTRDGNHVTSGPGEQIAFAATLEGTYSVRLHATDKDGDGSGPDAVASIVVTNAAPVVTSVTKVQAGGVRGQRLDFVAAFTDAGVEDAHAVTWDFGDGSPTVTLPAGDPAALRQSHVYATAGENTVTVTVSDGTDSGTGTVEFAVTVAELDVTDPATPTLLVGGTEQDDTIRLEVVRRTGDLELRVNNVLVGSFPASFARVVAFGQGGNDTINLSNAASRQVVAYGDGGNDTLIGAAAGDVLVGGAGDDFLVGGDGRDLLAGSAGADRLNGGNEEDILVAGATRHDAAQDTESFLAIVREWSRNDLTYEARIASLAAFPDGLLGHPSVADDLTADVLTGGKQNDWFLADVDGPVNDAFTDRAGTETVTDINPVPL